MKHVHDALNMSLCLLLLALAWPARAATPCNLKIGEYPGSSEKEGRADTSDVFSVDHEIVRPFDSATGQFTGERQHQPLTVLKIIDKATPGLHKALTTGQNLKSVVLDFYRIDPATRAEVKYYTIILFNARIVGIKTMLPTAFDPAYSTYGHMEEVRFIYASIEWRWIPDNIVETDNWHTTQSGKPAAQASAAPASKPASKPADKSTSAREKVAKKK